MTDNPHPIPLAVLFAFDTIAAGTEFDSSIRLAVALSQAGHRVLVAGEHADPLNDSRLASWGVRGAMTVAYEQLQELEDFRRLGISMVMIGSLPPNCQVHPIGFEGVVWRASAVVTA